MARAWTSHFPTAVTQQGRVTRVGVAGWAEQRAQQTQTAAGGAAAFPPRSSARLDTMKFPPPSQEEFNAASQPIQNTPGSNLYEATKKINPKTKSYSGGEEGKEVAPEISMRTFPLTPAVGWGSPLWWDRAGGCELILLHLPLAGRGPQGPKCRVLGVLGWDHEDLGAGEGTALGGKCPAGKRDLAGTKGAWTPALPHFLWSLLAWWL